MRNARNRQSAVEPAVVAARIRCAIYTRKSTDEGLSQEFNSLDAQREAGEAYIASQRHEGWLALPDRYDDGGFTGGNMERPALRRLMADTVSEPEVLEALNAFAPVWKSLKHERADPDRSCGGRARRLRRPDRQGSGDVPVGRVQGSVRRGTMKNSNLVVEFSLKPKRPRTPDRMRPPANTGKLPRVTRLMALAIKFDGLVRDGVVQDYSDLARLGHVTRARMTQIMNLLNLAADIQEEILFLPKTMAGRDPVSERNLRQVTAIVRWERQRKAWRELPPDL